MSRPARPGVPTLATLRKYGLSVQDFEMLLEAQGGVCAICGNKPNGRWNIDHYHVRNWKKRKPEVRKRYVRGILCWFCNRYYLGRAISIERAERVVSYLKRFEERLSVK